MAAALPCLALPCLAWPGLALALALAESDSLVAQMAHSTSHISKFKRGHDMVSRLGLSDDQKTKLQELHKSFHQERHSITEKYLDKLPSADKESIKGEMKAAQDKQDSNFRALLNPDQLKKFDSLKAARKLRHVH